MKSIVSKSTGYSFYSHLSSANYQHILRFDGGSRGNPGLSGCGAVIYKIHHNYKASHPISEWKEIWRGWHYVGDRSTNNVAEYSGLIEGLKKASDLKLSSLLIQGDSNLVLQHLVGSYRVKSPHLIPLYHESLTLLSSLSDVSFQHIPRNLNSVADKLSNLAMDTKESNQKLSKKLVLHEPINELPLHDQTTTPPHPNPQPIRKPRPIKKKKIDSSSTQPHNNKIEESDVNIQDVLDRVSHLEMSLESIQKEQMSYLKKEIISSNNPSTNPSESIPENQLS